MDYADTIAAELRRTAARYPELAAFHFHGRDRTYAEWDAYATRFARALLARGLRKGDRLCLLLPPSPEYLFCYLGAARIGVITAGISTRYRRHEIRAILANADPRMVIAADGVGEVAFAPLIEAARPDAPSLQEVIAFTGDGPASLAAMLQEGDSAPVDLEAAESVQATDPVAIVYTSGTTGLPKGALYNSAAMIALTRLFRTRLPAPPVPGAPSLWPGMSLTHIGAMARIHIQLAFASTMVLHDRFDAGWCFEQLLRLRPPALGGFPPVLMMLMRDPERTKHDFSFIKSVNFGGAPLAPHLVDEIKQKLGVEVYSGYSCTETVIISATLPSDPSDKRTSTVGRPTPGVEVRVVDADRRSVSPGVPGILAVRSPATMMGYWRNPAATAKAMDAEGWLYTEDYALIDDQGYIQLLGREKDVYFRAAFNVYPAEIEDVLNAHPKVAQSAVVGVPDDVLGYKGWVFVVANDPADPPTLEELRDQVGRELASYKRPDGLTVLDALPVNSMYKVDRRALREMWETSGLRTEGRAES